MKGVTGFAEFMRKQGIVGLALGFVLGGSVSKMVTSMVNDLLNPLIGLVFGFTTDLAGFKTEIGTVTFLWGDFLVNFIDFLALALVVYLGFKLLRLERLDKRE